MRKTNLGVLGSLVLAALTAQTAAAAERHHTRTTDRAQTNQFRNSNASVDRPYIAVQPDEPRYNGGMSAPAGR